jgi:RHS repeat-associated protein
MIRLQNTTPSHPTFGSVMEGRSFVGDTSGWYRFGFNGKEKDDEVSGAGNQYDYGFRIYNPHIGKFLSVDPKIYSFPMYSSYQYAGNKPIVAIDLDGLEDVWVHQLEMGDGTRTTFVYDRDDSNFEEVVSNFCAAMHIDRSTIPNNGLVTTFAIQSKFQGPLSGIRYDYTPPAIIHPDKSLSNTLKGFGKNLDEYHNKTYGQEGFVKFTDDVEAAARNSGTWVKGAGIAATLVFGTGVGIPIYRFGNALQTASDIIGAAKAFEKGDYVKVAIKAGALALGEIKDRRLISVAKRFKMSEAEKFKTDIVGDVLIDILEDNAEYLIDK